MSLQTNIAERRVGDGVELGQSNWPKEPFRWIENQTLFVSVPFTWNLPGLRHDLRQWSMDYDRAVVGGPAVLMMPEYLAGIPNVTIGKHLDGVLQRVNPQATRTTLGCTRKCGFCGIGKGLIEPGGLVELADWPDLPVLCDNNLLAASPEHFEKVIERLVKHGWCDFNQGLDTRYLTPWHASLLARIKEPICRLAYDHAGEKEAWETAYSYLRAAGIIKKNIRTYCLIAWMDGPKQAWERCEWIQSFGVKAFPMWYHELFALEHNVVTRKQAELGWDETARTDVMGWYYKHRKPTSIIGRTAIAGGAE